MILVTGVIFGFAWDKKTVTMVDGEKEVTIKTGSASVQDFLESQNVVLGPEDRVIPELMEKLTDGLRVVVKRAYKITLTMDKEKTEFFSAADTVGDILMEKGIVPDGGDIVSPGAGEKIAGATEIRIIRVSVAQEVKKAPIPYETRRIPNQEMSRGISRTMSGGQNGVEVQTWSVTCQDGQEVSRELVDRKVISNPVEKVMQVGTGQMVSRGGEVIRFKEALEVKATAYTFTGHNTANGTKPAYGTVAVDPSVIPFGSRLFIEGYGYGTALDKGSAIKGNRIDVFLESESEANRWGVRKVKMYIID
ncbi:MAG: 3D domain-containing protein [Desulfocucumaceae bacterium]